MSVILVDEDVDCLTACELMNKVDQSACLVVSSAAEGGTLQGILTERDVCARLVSKSRDLAKTKLCEVMTRSPDAVPSHEGLQAALEKMIKGKYRHLPVVDSRSVPIGVLDIMAIINRTVLSSSPNGSADDHTAAAKGSDASSNNGWFDRLWGKKTVAVADKNKNIRSLAADSGAVTVAEDTTCKEAAALMASKRASAVLVTGKNDVLLGIFSERDLLRRVVIKRLDPETTLLSAVMTRNPKSVAPETAPIEALRIMTTRHFRHLPVVESSGKLVGVLDILQLVMTASEQQNNQAAAAAAAAAAASSANSAVAAAAGSKWTLGRFFSAIVNAVAVEDEDSSNDEDNDDDDSDSSESPADKTTKKSSSKISQQQLMQRRGTEDSELDSHDIAEVGTLFAGCQVVRSGGVPSYVAMGGAGHDDQHMLSMTSISEDTDRLSEYRTPSNPSGLPTSHAVEHAFKFKDARGQFHRVNIIGFSFDALEAKVREAFAKTASPNAVLAIKYTDDEGDEIALASDADLQEAVALGDRLKWNVVKLTVALASAENSANATPVSATAPAAPAAAAVASDLIQGHYLELEAQGNDLMQGSKFEEALKFYRSALASCPSTAGPQHRARFLTKISSVQSIMGNTQEALEGYREVERMDVPVEFLDTARLAACDVLLEQNRIEAAAEIFLRIESAAKREQGSKAFAADFAQHVSSGKSQLAQNDVSRAIQSFTSAVRIFDALKKVFAGNQDMARAYLERGACYEKLDDHDMALQDYDKFSSLFPQTAEGHFRCASSHAALEQIDRARDCAKEALRLAPGFAPAAALLASLNQSNSENSSAPANTAAAGGDGASKIAALGNMLRNLQVSN